MRILKFGIHSFIQQFNLLVIMLINVRLQLSYRDWQNTGIIFLITTFQRDGSLSMYHLQSTMNKTTPSLGSSAFLLIGREMFLRGPNVTERKTKIGS